MSAYGKELATKLKLHITVLTKEKLKPRAYDVHYNLKCNCATMDLLHDISGRINIDLVNDISNTTFMQKDHALFDAFVEMEDTGFVSIILVADVDLFYMNLMHYVQKIIQKNVDLTETVECAGYGVYRV